MYRWRPTLEVWLAIFNVLSLVGLWVIAREWSGPSQLEHLGVFWTRVLSLPIAWSFFPPCPGLSTTADLVKTCVMVVVNAIVWAYLVGALLRGTFLARFDQTARKGESPED